MNQWLAAALILVDIVAVVFMASMVVDAVADVGVAKATGADPRPARKAAGR